MYTYVSSHIVNSSIRFLRGRACIFVRKSTDQSGILMFHRFWNVKDVEALWLYEKTNLSLRRRSNLRASFCRSSLRVFSPQGQIQLADHVAVFFVLFYIQRQLADHILSNSRWQSKERWFSRVPLPQVRELTQDFKCYFAARQYYQECRQDMGTSEICKQVY